MDILIAMRRHDERVLHFMLLRRHRVLDALMRVATHLADAPVAIGLALLLALGAVPALQTAGRASALTLLFSHLAVQLIKRVISRPRPHLPAGVQRLMEPPDRFSFPSGHAAASMSIALPLAIAVPGPFGALVLALAAFTGISRCYLGVHYPSDVVMGWVLAILAFISG